MRWRCRDLCRLSCMLASVSAFGASSLLDNHQLLPSGLDGTCVIYKARTVGLSWAEYSALDVSGKYHREAIVGVLYTPVFKLLLEKPVDMVVERRRNVDREISAAPLGHLIAYGRDDRIWLITIESDYYFVTFAQLKAAVDEHDPQFSKLYWKDYDEPRFKCQSRALYGLLQKAGKLPANSKERIRKKAKKK